MSSRRSLLKAVGGIGAVTAIGATGLGLGTISREVSAGVVDITSSSASISNDRGDVTRVTSDPQFTVNWENLDDAVGKVFWLLEASVDGGDFQPLYRATPWLTLDAIGTTGTFQRPNTSNGGLGPLVVADEDGRPEYENWDWANYGAASLETYLDGTSMGSADNYQSDGSPPVGTMLAPQNNFPSENAGYYGAASDTEPFDNDDDNAGSGSNKTTGVTLRYTIELQRPNLSQLEYRVSESGSLTMPPGYDSMSDEEKKAALAEIIDGVEASDIDAGNSRIVMEGEDGYQSFDGYDDGAGIPYDVLQDNSSHVGIIVAETSFSVTATNEGSDSGAQGSSGTGVE